MNDDHGDQFPGALPARPPSSPARTGGVDRLVRMRSAGVPERRTTLSRLSRLGRSTRRTLQRFDRYTLDVFNPGPPFRPHAGR